MEIYRLESEIPDEVSDSIRQLLILSKELSEDLSKSFSDQAGVQHFDGVDLDEAWNKDLLQRLDYIVHLSHKIFFDIEKRDDVQLTIMNQDSL